MAPEKVRVTVAMNPPILLVDDRHKLRLNGTAVVRLEAPLSIKSSAPIDLIALLNVNHSMNEAVALPETLSRLDMVKKAMKFIIRQLDDDDRLAIVAFNNQVIKECTTGLLEISGGNRMALEQKVNGLMAKGDTSFKPSLDHAVKLLDDRADKKRLGFIILISDGQDNIQFKWREESVAPTDPIRNILKKYPVHTFGLCKAHDPKALQFIAKESYGTYYSITDVNLYRKIMEAFAVCLAGMKTVIAIETCINITSSSLNITRIDAGSYQAQGGSRGILIGSLYAGEVKDFVVYFYYSTGEWSPGYYTILSGISASVTYKDVRRQSSTTDNCSVSLPIHTAESGSVPPNPCPPFPVVLQQIIRFKVVDLLTSTLKEFLVLKEEASGVIDGDEGSDLVLQVMAANLLQRKWREFKQTDESWKEAPRAFLDIGGIDKDVTAMVSNLKSGLGVGCIYSWLSSYQMQRAAVTGLQAHNDATGFRTPAMEAMVHEAHKELALEASSQGQDMEVCKRAIELLAMINRRFELWSKLDGDVPLAFQSPSEKEDDEFRNLSTVLREDISRAKQHDIYLAAENAVKNWRSSFIPEEKMH